MITAAALLRLLLELVIVLRTSGALYFLLLLLLQVLMLLLCIADLLLKSFCYACGILCLMRLWQKKGYTLQLTGNTIPGMKSGSEKYLPGTY